MGFHSGCWDVRQDIEPELPLGGADEASIRSGCAGLRVRCATESDLVHHAPDSGAQDPALPEPAGWATGIDAAASCADPALQDESDGLRSHRDQGQ